jgi:hypothetical protein
MRVSWLSRKNRILVCLLAVCAFANAQQPANTGSVTGFVHMADTGKAATGITVFLQPPAKREVPDIDSKTGEFIVRDEPRRGDFYAKVEPSGAFEIKNVKPGFYFVLTYAPGYLSQDDYIFPGALAPEQNGGPLPAFVQEVHVMSGAAEPVDLRLQRGGSIEGTIWLSDGRPAHTGAQVANEVAVSVEVKTKEGKFIRTGGAAHTDSSGHYRFEGLAPAAYVVFVALPGKMVPTSRGLQGSGGEIVYASNTVRASQAHVVDVSGTENYDQIDIEVPVAGLHKVVGKVIASTGAVNNSAIVRLYPSGEPSLSRTSPLQANGSFSFDDVANDEYTIAVEFQGETEMVGLTEDKTGLRMRMKKAPYKNVSQNIRVAGQDPPAVVLRTELIP